MDVPTLIRFLGGNYTGEYRDSKATIKALKNVKCNKKVIEDLQRLLEKGCPNNMNASLSHAHFLDFLKYRNHASIDNTIDKYEDNEQRR